jgi:hypothetical protein
MRRCQPVVLSRFSMMRPHFYPCRCHRCNAIHPPFGLRCVATPRPPMSSGRFKLPTPVLPGCGAGCGDPGRSVVAGHRTGGHAYRPDRLLARVVQKMGAAQPHHVWLFANRLKVLLRDGHGIWLAQRWLHQGRFHWQDGEAAVTLTLQ